MYVTKLLEEYLEVSKHILDSYTTINGKTDTIKDWFEENVLPLEKVQQLFYLQSELEDTVFYDEIFTDD